MLGTLPELSIQIVEAIMERGRMTIGAIVNLTGANRNTVKKHAALLVDAKHLAQHGTRKGTWYGKGQSGSSEIAGMDDANLEKYLPDMEEYDMTRAQKTKCLRALNHIMGSFAGRAFGLDLTPFGN